eukprot:5229917-Pleurochrysis_carterae.AAC.1
MGSSTRFHLAVYGHLTRSSSDVYQKIRASYLRDKVGSECDDGDGVVNADERRRVRQARVQNVDHVKRGRQRESKVAE